MTFCRASYVRSFATSAVVCLVGCVTPRETENVAPPMAEGPTPAPHLGSTSYNDPQIPPVYARKAPWFDGWYTRITDTDGNHSVAVIAAFFKAEGTTYEPGKPLPGYLAVLVSDGNGAPTRSFEVFPDRTFILTGGEPTHKASDFFSPSHFEWRAEGFGSVTESSIDVSIPGVVEVHAQVGARVPFGYLNAAAGPQGFVAMLPLPLYWHVESLTSPTDYRWRIDGDSPSEWRGTGHAHQEKNWGQAFPSSWLWGQGIQKGNRAQFVFGGGRVGVGPVAIEPYLAGFRSPNANITMSPDKPVFVTKSFDACAGTLSMTLKGPVYTLAFDASAPPSSFGSVSVPTRDGFRSQFGEESFSATYKVSAYAHDPITGLFGRDVLFDEQTFENAALEFGAGYHCVPR